MRACSMRSLLAASTAGTLGECFKRGPMGPFVYAQSATRVILGVGVIDRRAEEVQRLPAKRVLVLTTPGQNRLATDAAGRLGALTAGVYAKAVMHVPIEVARAARDEA